MIDRRLTLATIRLVCVLVLFALNDFRASAHGQPRVVAYLGDQTITQNDIDFQLGRVASDSLEPLLDLPTAITQATVHLIAQQRQALQTMRTRKLAVGREDMERWLEENSQQNNGEMLAAAEIIRKQSEKAGISESNFRDHFAFRLSWQRYLQQQLTERNIAKHFENQSKRFDGTRFQVSMIDVAAAAGKSDHRDKVTKLLADLREPISDGKLSWEEAARSLQESSLIGTKAGQLLIREELWVRGTGDLEPTLITEIIKLAPEDVSQPIQSPTGVHLVKLHLLEAGERPLSEVRDEVRAHMLLHLLQHLARQSESVLPLKAAN